jgi:hypothetical protein
MNWQRGLFRLWLVASLLWVPLAIWLEWPCVYSGTACPVDMGLAGLGVLIITVPLGVLLALLGIKWALSGFRQKPN